MGTLAVAEALQAIMPAMAVTTMIDNDAEAIEAVRSVSGEFEIVENLDQEIAYIQRMRPQAIVVNMLNNNPERLERFRRNTDLLVTIDDTSDAAKVADIRINPLYYAEGAVNDFSFVALSHEFIRANGIPKDVARRVANILVTQGGADTYGFTPKILRALDDIDPDCRIIVVIGPAFKHHHQLNECINQCRRRFEIVHSPANMCELMQQSDLAITAGGNTMFELACVGVPAIVICGEPFEQETAQRLQQYGVVRNLGFGENVSEETIAETVGRLMEASEERRSMGGKGQKLIDGRGAERVAAMVARHIGGSPTNEDTGYCSAHGR